MYSLQAAIDLKTALPASEAISIAANLQPFEAIDKLDAGVAGYGRTIDQMTARCYNNILAKKPVSRDWFKCSVL
jgi:hypothetical protein